MLKVLELKIKNNKNIYQELAIALAPHRERPVGSVLFIVEGTRNKPVIGIRYPGRKLVKKTPKFIRSNSVLWANLFDFEVVPFENGKEVTNFRFTFQELMKDFQENKMGNKDFWNMVEELYYKNTITKKPPKLLGIDTVFYLQILKWIWLQEDLNYKYSWEEVKSPIRYRLETRTGTTTRKGAGRGKFFAALVLLKNKFSFEEVKKIIPLY